MRRPVACQNAHASLDIRELETRNQQLTQRVEQLEELFRLAQLKRFAPSSEKLKDRVFDEAEEVALAEPVEDDPDGVFALPDTGLPAVDGSGHQKRGRKPLPADLPRTRIEYDLPEDQKVCPCCQGAMHRMGEQTCEQLHIHVKASVLQHVRFKYACRHYERHAEHTPHLDRAHAGATAARQQRECGDDRHGDDRQVRRWHAALPHGRCVGPLEYRGQSRHAGALDHPACRTAPVPAVRGIARHAARAVADPWRRDDGAGAQGGRHECAEQVVHVGLSQRRSICRAGGAV
ncbi:transposase IS66 [Caballeronia glebae]|uniref:Transposase IS66 n=1 Tax=Caballeronia glebae TaxID=1777143 RepID=A0A158AVQ5_9BURK|nr:transposase IS66 [Caballeronia glebae]